jgi:chitodextrinase
MYAANPNLTALQARNILFTTALDLGSSGWDREYGWGRVDAAKAVALAASTVGNNVPDTQPPSTPDNLTTSNLTSDRVTLSWSPSMDNVGVSGYDIFRNGSKLTSVSGTMYTDYGLSENTTYSYTVVARDAAGNVSLQSFPVSVKTLSAPLTIVSSAVVSKSQTDATIAVTTNKVSTVTVRYGTSASNLNLTVQSTSQSTTHSVSLPNLTSGTRYYYQVVASDGSSTISSSVSNFKTTGAKGGGKPNR